VSKFVCFSVLRVANFKTFKKAGSVEALEEVRALCKKVHYQINAIDQC
jgi:hypothetical protein